MLEWQTDPLSIVELHVCILTSETMHLKFGTAVEEADLNFTVEDEWWVLYFLYVLSGMPIMESCCVDGTLLEHTIIGLPACWVDTVVSRLYLSIRCKKDFASCIPEMSPVLLSGSVLFVLQFPFWLKQDSSMSFVMWHIQIPCSITVVLLADSRDHQVRLTVPCTTWRFTWLREDLSWCCALQQQFSHQRSKLHIRSI